MAEAVRCLVDGEGRLVSADPRLIDLNTRAGGSVGAPLAIPQLATLARLARTLGILISRGVIAADGDADLDLWVRARPDGDLVDMAIGGWTVRPPRTPWLMTQPDIGTIALSRGPSFRWQTDAQLNLTSVTLGDGDPASVFGRDVIGEPLTRIVRLIEDADGDLPIISSLANGLPLVGQRAVRRDQPQQELVLNAQSLHDQDGRFIGFRGAAAPAALTVADDADGPGEEPLSDPGLARRLSTALREPLSRIVARADSISAQVDGPLRRDYADYASDIASAGRHLLALIEDLADLQAVEQAGFTVPVEPIDLADIARRAAGLLAVRAGDKNVRIDRPDPEEILPAQGDFRRVLQILVNLIGNAVRYSPPGSMVWLRLEHEDDTAVIIVADQGKGISADDQDRIFEKFERVDPSEHEGSGLGLYISRRLARAMSGDLTVDSAPGQGARFILTLPAG